MTHPPAGPANPTPPGGPGRDEVVTPLDPNTPKGREVAARLTRTLAVIELEILRREASEQGRAA